MVIQQNVIHPPVYPGEFDESDVELKESFDWKSIRAVCIGAIREHPAYGMSFEEYAKRRSEFTDDDGQPPVSLSFRLPPYPAFIIPSFARRRRDQTGESLYRYLSLTLEMGLIKFQHDYHDTYSAINVATDMLSATTPEKFLEHKWLCTKLGEEKINLGTSTRANVLFTPHVGYWMSSAIKQICGDLKMTQSDLTVLCVYIGIIEDSKTMHIPELVLAEFQELVKKFELYLGIKYDSSCSAVTNYCGSEHTVTSSGNVKL